MLWFSALNQFGKIVWLFLPTVTLDFPLQKFFNSWDCTVTKSYGLFIGIRTSGRTDNLRSAFTVE